MIATTLQASLLPRRLPTIPGVDVAVRYWAAGEGIDRRRRLLRRLRGRRPLGRRDRRRVRHRTRRRVAHRPGPPHDPRRGVERRRPRRRAPSTQPRDSTIRAPTRSAPRCTAHSSPTANGVRFTRRGRRSSRSRSIDRADGRCETVGATGHAARRIHRVALHDRLHRAASPATSSCSTPTASPTCGRRTTSLRTTWRIVTRRAAAGATTAEDVADQPRRASRCEASVHRRNDDIALLVLKAAPR